jgi:RecA-family ATPase
MIYEQVSRSRQYAVLLTQATVRDVTQSFITVLRYSETEASLKKFTNSVHTSKKTRYLSIKKINWLMHFREIIAVYAENENSELLTVKASGTYIYH